jgi:hypothetical protein
MSKPKFNFREAYERIDQIKGRLTEMAENLESDKEREAFTEAEQGERKQLFRELDILEMKIKANTPTIEVMREDDIPYANAKIRECLDNGQRFELKIARAVAQSFGGNTSTYGSGLAGTNPSGLTTHDIVEPLYNKTILKAIGAPLLTGLKGNHQWPVVETFHASINDEGAALGDTKIPISKLIAKPERLGIAVPITREALNETDNLVQLVATQYMPVAIAELMNKIMFSQTKVNNATDLVGPFIPANMKAENKKTYTGSAPTLAQIIGAKSAILKWNVKPEGLCYVMSDTTKGELEATPKWQGANSAIVDENGNICGVPVFTTNEVPDGQIYVGAFKYAPQGLFGDMVFIVDPYSLSRKNAIDCVLNVDYAISVLRQEAFAVLSKIGVFLDKSELAMTVGDTFDLTATAFPVGTTVTWATSAAAKATVANGKVTAVAAGNANITASITVGGQTYTATCAVTVSAAG